ncbi:MAG: hypothetical protein CVU41_14090 [Chloroflexi bacterium HGW-Chloroflexi-3]|nr:MAG: hypothetical protein CVU41_14090 [Chloroflexi bacterium HGW-Chloroflexi-3]
MNDITLSLLVILATGLLVILIFVLVRRNRSEQEKQLTQMALERGRKLDLVKERLAYGQRIHHRDWVIELLTESICKLHFCSIRLFDSLFVDGNSVVSIFFGMGDEKLPHRLGGVDIIVGMSINPLG